MGTARPRTRDQERPPPLSGRHAALVVPGVPTFSVDSGFWYSIPDHLKDGVVIGARVRIPLSGRRVRGFVVDLADERGGELKEIQGVSGKSPVFDRNLLKSLRWAAQHYVAPLSVVLEKAAPPTLPAGEPIDQVDPVKFGLSEHPMTPFAASVAKGERRPVLAYVAHWEDTTWIDALAPILRAQKTVLIVAATVRETERIADLARASFPDSVVQVPGGNDSSVTLAWEKANQGGRIVIGTPRVAVWPVTELGLAVVIEEGRRAMKDRQTPTIHVREMVRTRARIEGFGLVFVGPTPSIEVIAAGTEVFQPGRPWGLVEVVDRREDPPGSGFLSERTVGALRSSLQAGEDAFVFTHRRAEDASARCVACRALRRCTQCGSQVGQNPACPRCNSPSGPCSECGGKQFESMGSIPFRLISEIGTRLGRETVGEIGEGSRITVGTERDLAGLSGLKLAVAVDVDALLYGQNYRSSEEALRILARLVGSVSRGKGYRTILQTSNPESDLVAALRRGDPIPYLEGVLAARARDGFPPATEMMALETRSIDEHTVSGHLHELAPGMVLGPVKSGDGHRWLIQGDLGRIKTEMRGMVQRLRDAGAVVRVDVDPIDL